MTRISRLLPLALLQLPMAATAGFFAPAAGESESTAVAAADPGIEAWASAYEDYQPGTNVDAGFRTPQKALGYPGNSNGGNEGFTYDIVSLGRGGSITLRFPAPIEDRPGFDFAVFENSFDDTFLELARVEVSSDGNNFFAFPAFSLTPNPVSSFGNVDTTDIEQVAGKYRGGFGTPFDLAQLAGTPGLDLDHVRYVRLVDIVGDGNAPNDLDPQSLADWLGITVEELPEDLRTAAENAPAAIYDPYPTSGSAGFDLDAVGVMSVGTVPAVIDIDPWSAGNEVDPESTALIPVAVLSSSIAAGGADDFDATTIDTGSIGFGPAGAPVAAGPYFTDFNADGQTDIGFSFQTQDTGIACGDTAAPISGMTTSGVAFDGSDSVTTPDCPGCHP